MKRQPSALRAWVGISLAGLICLVSVFAVYEEQVTYFRENPDPWAITRQQARLAALKVELPANSVLGYYSDVPFGDRRAGVAFFAVLYTLAPHLVVDDAVRPQPEMVVGNFSKRMDLEPLERERGLRLVKDYGLGVMLLRREAR
ncbi:MAG: hypothetical protein ACE141_03480 [Bryobacteraceae bacterium]